MPSAAAADGGRCTALPRYVCTPWISEAIANRDGVDDDHEVDKEPGCGVCGEFSSTNLLAPFHPWWALGSFRGLSHSGLLQHLLLLLSMTFSCRLWLPTLP